MKKVLGYLKDFLRENFHGGLYLAVAVFLVFSLAFNYTLDFEDSYLDPMYGTFLHWLSMFCFQGVPFLIVCLLIHVFVLNKTWIRSREFWLKFIIGFSILALDRTFYWHKIFLDGMPRVDFIFYGKLIRWVSSIFTAVIPLIIFYMVYEKDNKTIYGLGPKKPDLKPYAILLGLTAIVIAAGSFLPDIQAYYPKYKTSYGDQWAQMHQLNRWVAVAIYEISYGSDFISVELFFRGFLIMAFSRIVGPNVVLAMAATYCYLHFGKPLGESVSSIFGGYILGIIALRTQHIWGGIMIHVGVAWLMEFFASLHRID
ncbi:MAG: CPBP family intramembrane glutamic endopeptidase [Cyclobacteriaceae bacterium]